MKNMLKNFLAVVVAGCILTVAATAAPINSAVYNTDTDTITVRGNMCYTEPESSLGNILYNSSCDSVEYTKEDGTSGYAWTNAAGGISDISVIEENENKYLCYSNRIQSYHGIRQNMYELLQKYGKGKYRVSGKVRTNKKTVIAADASGNTKEFTAETAPMYAHLTLKNNTITINIGKVASEWVEFSDVINVDSFGYADKAKTTELSDWDLNTAIDIRTSSKLRFTEDGVEYTTADLRDVCIDDVTIEPIRAKGPYVEDDARISVEDADGNIIYLNDIKTDENGDYAIAFQLPDGVSSDGLKAKVSGEHTAGVSETDIVKTSVNASIRLSTSDEKIKVEFDIFDMFDSSGHAGAEVVAATYDTYGRLENTQILPVNIDLDTPVTQYVELDCMSDKSGFVKIFVFNNINKIIPLCSIPSEAVTCGE